MASSGTVRGLERNAIVLTEALFQSITHMAPAVATVVSGLVVWGLVYRGISTSTRGGGALGLIEIGTFLPVSALLIVNAGSRNPLPVFIPGAAGLKPALQGMVFCLLAFVGFEAAAP